MANIGTYSNDSTIDPADKLIGTDGTSGADSGKTKNYTISALTTHISDGLGGYPVYTALLNQSGTEAPVATILKNTTGKTFTWTRQSAGNYTVTASSALFTVNKTIVFLNNGSTPNITQVPWSRASDTTVTLSLGSDGRLTNGSFEIRIYS
jgi:hypothetical protein